MADNHQYINKLPYFNEIYEKSKLWLKAYSFILQMTLDLEYQDCGDELQNLITEITAMRDPGLFISVHNPFQLYKPLLNIELLKKC